VSRKSNSAKKTVEMKGAARPSRIRREPPPPDNVVTRKLDKIDWRSPEWERRVVVIGIVMFALALWVITIGISQITSH
jgi:hypothetical protein